MPDFEYPPENVQRGVKDFLVYELKKPIGPVRVKVDGTITVDMQGTEIPEDVETELRKILPDGYTLKIKE